MAESKASSRRQIVFKYEFSTWRVYETQKTFTLSPTSPHPAQVSLSIDKGSRKMAEHGKYFTIKQSPIFIALEHIGEGDQVSEAIDIFGFLGILNIFQSHYLLVVTECEEVGRVETCLAAQKLKKAPVIFAVTQVKLLPFQAKGF